MKKWFNTYLLRMKRGYSKLCNYFCCMYGVFFGGFLVFKKETLVLKITYFKILLTKLDINGKEYFLSNRQGKYRGE